MANIDAVRGFKLVGTTHGRDPILETCYIASGDATATFVGDAVKLASGGLDPSGRAASVAQAAAGNPTIGVVVSVDQVRGISAANFNPTRKHRPASTAMYVNVCTDPDAIYEVQCDDVADALVVADGGLNADIIVAAGNATTGMSGMELDSSTADTTATLAWRILRMAPRPDNDVASDNKKVWATQNLHQRRSNTGTTGV